MDGRDRSGPRRFTADDPDGVSDDVTDGGGGSAERTARAAHARRRTAARERKRKAPGRSGRHGELTDDQKSDGEATDGAGDEEETAGLFGSTTATMLRWSSAAAKGRTRTAMRRRPRRRPSRAMATAGTTAAHGWSGGGDGKARAHGARSLPATRGEGEGGGEKRRARGSF
uniref:OSJNBa0032N05.9 protein n=1 Tax=Oryza sativa subsp. japonica TaxID=39947 RepID=Q5CAI9_ORYSJ|nr:OSJNBa0032N05.9 [Oryza sativa Japonica Group]